MGESYLVRAAVAEDAACLIEMRSRYFRNLYKSLIDSGMLEEWQETEAPEIGEWLASGRYCIDVLEIDGKIQGYIVYGLSGGNDVGTIVEARAEYPSDAERKREMVEAAIGHLRSMGAKMVRIWLQHDNFRIRFLFESLGFCRDGTMKTDSRFNEDLAYDGYTYLVK